MSRIPVTFLSLLGSVIFFLPTSIFAQRTFGVQWDVPVDNQEAISELNRFQELEIEYLEIEEVVSDQIWTEIRDRNFHVYVQTPINYPVVQTFLLPDSSVTETYRYFVEEYSGREIEAFSAFAYGQTSRSSFTSAFEPFANELYSSFSVPIYFKDWSYGKQSIDSLLDFKMIRVNVNRYFQSLPDSSFSSGNAFLYSPEASIRNMMAPLKWFIQKTTINPQAILFFDAAWLLDFTEIHSSAGSIIADFATTRDALFPLPQEELPTNDSHSEIVLILILLWGAFALNYNFAPTYRKSLFRYFFSHAFFVEDVKKRHIRSIEPCLLILGQQIAMGGIFFYTIAFIFFSDSGLDVLSYYFPLVPFLGSGYFSFFFIGCMVMLIWEVICLLWLYLASKKSYHFSQIAILYSWPLQLNLLTSTIIVTLTIANIDSTLLSAFLILFLLVTFFAFPITAFDTAQQIKKNQPLFFTGTTGLYIILLVGLSVFFLSNGYLLNILRLAASIS